MIFSTYNFNIYVYMKDKRKEISSQFKFFFKLKYTPIQFLCFIHLAREREIDRNLIYIYIFRRSLLSVFH